MSDIVRGITFTTSIPDAASAHQLVDNAVIQPSFISTKTAGTPADGDSFIYVNSNGAFKRCVLTRLVAAFPSGGPGNEYALRKLGITSETAAAGDDARFPARLHNIRKANFNSPDTDAVPKDFAFASKSLSGITVIDWDLSNVFYETLGNNKTYTFLNVRDGRKITLVFKPQGHSITLPGTLSVVGINDELPNPTFIQYEITKSPVGTTALRWKIA